jgi:hypothetical protein
VSTNPKTLFRRAAARFEKSWRIYKKCGLRDFSVKIEQRGLVPNLKINEENSVYTVFVYTYILERKAPSAPAAISAKQGASDAGGDAGGEREGRARGATRRRAARGRRGLVGAGVL